MSWHFNPPKQWEFSQAPGAERHDETPAGAPDPSLVVDSMCLGE